MPSPATSSRTSLIWRPGSVCCWLPKGGERGAGRLSAGASGELPAGLSVWQADADEGVCRPAGAGLSQTRIKTSDRGRWFFRPETGQSMRARARHRRLTPSRWWLHPRRRSSGAGCSGSRAHIEGGARYEGHLLLDRLVKQRHGADTGGRVSQRNMPPRAGCS